MMTSAPKYTLGARVYHPHHGYGLVTFAYAGDYVVVVWDAWPAGRAWPAGYTVRADELRWQADAERLGLTAPLPAEHNYVCERCLWRTDGLNTYLAHKCEPGLAALRTYQRKVGAL